MRKIVIFDMDGVLFDSIGYAREYFMKSHPGVTVEMYNELHSGNYYTEAEKVAHLKMEMTEDEEKKHREDYAKVKSGAVMFTGIKELLIELHENGNILVLNTNAFERNCLPLLDKADIRKLFDLIAAADTSKDKVKKFDIIADKYGANKKDFIFVTDALGDVLDAEKAGVATIAVTYGVHGKSHFERNEHPCLIGIADSTQELRSMILSWLA